MSPTDDDSPLTVADCARRLGVSTQKIRDDIFAGELKARVSTRRSGRTLYRIERCDWAAYLARVWPYQQPKQPKQTR